MNVEYVTSRVMHYRIPFLNALTLRKGWRVRVVHSGPSVPSNARTWEEECVPVRRLGSFRVQKARRPGPSEVDVRVVMFDLHWPAGVAMGLLGRKDTPLVWWGHGLGGSRLSRAVRKQLALMADAVIVYGHRGLADVVAAGLPAHRVHVAPNTMWVDTARDTSSGEKGHFLFVGRLQARKGIPDLIRAFARIAPESPLELVIVGEGESAFRDGLERLAAAEGVEGRVRFTGAIYDPDELDAVFAKAVAYVSPGHVGLGVLHAFSYGVPVVTTRDAPHAPEFEWVEDGVSGLLTDGSGEGLAAALGRLAADQPFARALGRRAFETYEGPASPTAMLEGFTGAIEAAFESRRRPA